MNVFTMLYKIMPLQSVLSLSYSDENVNMGRPLLLDFLLRKHLLHTHKFFDDAVFRLDIVLCNETRFIAVGSLIDVDIYFTYR